MSRPNTITERHPTSTVPPTPAGPSGGEPATGYATVTGGILVLLGGLAAILQLVLPWSSTANASVSGWGTYYNTAHHGVGEIVAAYAILVSAIAGVVMLVAAIRLLMPNADHRLPVATATGAAAVAIVCAAWSLIAGAGPNAAHETFGWYLFLLSGVFGIIGVLLARSVLTVPTLLMLLAGVAALVQLAVPWFSSGRRATTGWQQYYNVAHPSTSDVLSAYAIIIAAIAGLVVLVVGILLARGVGRDRGLVNVAFVGSLVLLACAAWWLAAGTPPRGAILSFGWYLFLVAGLLGLLGALARGAAGARLDGSSVLLIVGGLFAIVQLALPWFSASGRSSTGWQQYYNTSHPGFAGVISAYAIIVAALAGIVMLLAGFAFLGRRVPRRGIGTVALVAALVEVACMLWWLGLGPMTLKDAFGSASFGWYLFLVAGIIGAFGAGRARARAGISVDRISFMAVFLGLPLVIFVVFVLSPFVQAIYYSLTSWNGFTATKPFVGMQNYINLFQDDKFRRAIVNSIELGIVVPLVTIVLAIAIATMVTVGGPSRGPVRGIRASSLYRVVSFFPYTIPAIVIGLIWANVLNPSAGILNAFLTGIGLDQFENFAWLGVDGAAMPVTMFVIIWGFVGFYAVFFVAAIKGVSAEVYEAARLDGAGRFRTATRVTVPLIRDSVQTAYIYVGIAALDSFVYVAALNPFGGPNNSTLTMSQDLYLVAFHGTNKFGYATAMGVILAIVTLLFATIVFAVNRFTGGGSGTPRARKRRETKSIAVAAQPAATTAGGMTP